MGVLWDKVWRDLWENKGRTIQVVLIIAVGTFAIGMIIGTRQFMISGMQLVWGMSSPATVYLWTSPGIDEDGLAALGRVDGVTAIDGIAQAGIEWRLAPGDPWQPAGISARRDYDEQIVSTYELIDGAWPHKKFFAVGQGGDAAYGIDLGDRVYIRVDDYETEITIDGVLQDQNVQPPSFGGNAQFYTTLETFGHLTGGERFNRIFAATAGFDPVQAQAIADAMQKKLEKQDIMAGGASPRGGSIADPSKHFFQDPLDGLFFIMGFMATITLILGLFLVYNTITALINRQTNQIGILKAIGARRRTIFMLYLTTVFAYGVMALMLALPLGAWSAQVLGDYLMSSFNAEGTFELSPLAIQAQIIIALVAPVLASLGPLWTASRITVREAISYYGLRAEPTLLDRFMARLRYLPELLALTISNTFRHKQRVILTEITLVLSGLIFMAVMTTRDSATYTFGELLFSILRFDVNYATERAERIERVQDIALSYPGVEAVEAWYLQNAEIRLAGAAESNDDKRVAVFGVPLPTDLYGPQMVAGRWLAPDDGNAVVLNQKVADEAGLAVGDTVTLKIGVDNESEWLIVGLLFDPVVTVSAHVPLMALGRAEHRLNRANTIWIQTTTSESAGIRQLAQDLRTVYNDENVRLEAGSVFGKDTSVEIIDGVMVQFAVIFTLLATMSVLIGVVGSLALSGVLSLNVLERRREIGVLRAIGASSAAVGGQFVGEGLILGLLSWLIAWPLSLPVGQLMVSGLSSALGSQLVYQYTPAGPLIWLAIITVLSVAASGLPARSATRVSVRECLAYE
ncbi:MAG: ABC transporter permease [Caldilinea sp.]|nr:ABC transporter permease [Caldilineaceae bacterium]MCB9117407.1 ABC transporter permease [Caldilineaceae bacterium]MCB9119404.1 ABC transporter permease [Caldilineaceae bacterium]MCB9125700.1 ABC transporter permease [Caldilineaceae bacterium]MCW5841140.1 ABC transporter permease [Caldilinea sp.]